ncbi:FAD/NAD(P)-binding domain-containing protein [Marasmius fiardii PR-910]|nr:FAD/NAD(P)-binding domain-containing protein [Marasmius fiardii PR-910]
MVSAVSTKTIVVLGAAYGGNRAAQIMAAGLPEGWRIILVDRNTHFNHVYVMPRLAVLPGHENKAFIPYTRVFWKNTPLRESPHILLHAHVVSVHPHHVILSKAFPEQGLPTTRVDFDYLVYALGSQLPDPLNLWGPSPSASIVKIPNPSYNGTKKDSVAWLKQNQKVIEDSSSVLVVGGGALGIQFATDIAHIYPSKAVTLLHSRHRLMPLYEEELHLEVLKGLESLGVNVILGERLDMTSVKDEPVKFNELGQRVVRTVKGRELAADYIMLCTGQKPNTEILKAMDESTINPNNNLAYVLRTMQLGAVSASKMGSPKVASSSALTPLSVATTPDTSSSVGPLQSPEEQLQAALEKISLAEKEALENGDVESDEETLASLEPEEDEDKNEKENGLWSPYPHIFCVGDSADAFDAIKAGHTAYWQGEVAGRNIVRLVKGGEEPLEEYYPGLPAIKVSLGLRKAAFSVRGVVGVKADGVDDLQAPIIWNSWGYEINSDKDFEA